MSVVGRIRSRAYESCSTLVSFFFSIKCEYRYIYIYVAKTADVLQKLHFVSKTQKKEAIETKKLIIRKKLKTSSDIGKILSLTVKVTIHEV